MRIALSPSERWLIKAAEWKPELSSKYRTNRAIGRPKRRWEDDINKFLKLEEAMTEIATENDNNCKKSWIKAAKDQGRWISLENVYTKTAEERSENNSRHKRTHNADQQDM